MDGALGLPGTDTVLVSKVNAPLLVMAPASKRPHDDEEVPIEIDVLASILPSNTEYVPIVAELPTCQNTFDALAPLVNTIWLPGVFNAPAAVVSVDGIWKMNTELVLPCPFSVSVPVMPMDELVDEIYRPGGNVALPEQPIPAPAPPPVPIVPQPNTVAPGRLAGVMLLYAACRSDMTALAVVVSGYIGVMTVPLFTVGGEPPQAPIPAVPLPPGTAIALHVVVGSSTTLPFTTLSGRVEVLVTPAADAMAYALTRPRLTGAGPVAAGVTVVKLQRYVHDMGVPVELVTEFWIAAL